MFLRGEGIVCGTTTTGTGTLTLAACPSGVGGLDPVASGLFGTSGAWPCNPVIIEYTDATFATISKMELGQSAILTLSGTIGGCTLTRVPTVTQTGGAADNTAPSAISIGTAANTLIFFGPTSQDTVQPLQAYSVSGITNADGLGFSPNQGILVSGTNVVNFGVSGGTWLQRIKLDLSGLIKSVTVRVVTPRTTPTSNSVSAALFEIGTTGLPGKKIIDFGTVSGTSAAPLGAAGNVTMTASVAQYIPAGYYILGLLPVFSGGSATPTLMAAVSTVASPFGTAIATTGGPIGFCTVAAGDLNDPPTLTSIAVQASSRNEIAMIFRST